MTVPFPTKPRSFLCTKCGSSAPKEGEEDKEHPMCGNTRCGYLGLTFPPTYSVHEMQAYGAAVAKDLADEIEVISARGLQWRHSKERMVDALQDVSIKALMTRATSNNTMLEIASHKNVTPK